MKKNPPSIREVNAASKTLRSRVNELADEGLVEPTWEEDRAWEQKHPSPKEVYRRKVEAKRKRLQSVANEIILAGEMGQITSEEFYAKVKAF